MLVILPAYARYPCSLVLMTKGIDWCPVGTSWHHHILFPQQQWLHLIPEAEVSVEIWLKWCCKSLTWLRLTNWLLYSSFSPMELVRCYVSYKSSVARDRSLLSFIELLGLSRIWRLNSGCRLWLNHALFLSTEHRFQCLVENMGHFAPVLFSITVMRTRCSLTFDMLIWCS